MSAWNGPTLGRDELPSWSVPFLGCCLIAGDETGTVISMVGVEDQVRLGTPGLSRPIHGRGRLDLGSPGPGGSRVRQGLGWSGPVAPGLWLSTGLDRALPLLRGITAAGGLITLASSRQTDRVLFRVGATVLSCLMLQRCWLIHTDTWAGSRAWSTTVARSSRTECRSTVSFRRAAKAATVWSAS